MGQLRLLFLTVITQSSTGNWAGRGGKLLVFNNHFLVPQTTWESVAVNISPSDMAILVIHMRCQQPLYAHQL